MAAPTEQSKGDAEDSIKSESRTLSPLPLPLAPAVPDTGVRLRYLNNLLPAIGYLDLANGLDFPANVWNQVPIPTFAKVLMGLGGSIALLSVVFTIIDLRRARSNVAFLRQERKLLKQRRSADPVLWKLEQSWLDVNFRELGWELIDRVLLDACMLVAGVLVGVGTLMAIRGDIRPVFHASNLLSGYIGNSFVALYAIINMVWSVFMWKRAARNHAAFKRSKMTSQPNINRRLQKHAKRHQLFAIVNGPTAIVSGVASLLSATLWPGYVVLIPGIIGSVFANHYWRLKLGYSRGAFQDLADMASMDILERIRIIVFIRSGLQCDDSSATNFCEMIATSEKNSNQTIDTFLRDFGLYERFQDSLRNIDFAHDEECADPEQGVCDPSELDYRQRPRAAAAINECIRSMDKMQLRYEERFLSELFGCYCYWAEVHDAKLPLTRNGRRKSLSKVSASNKHSNETAADQT